MQWHNKSKSRRDARRVLRQIEHRMVAGGFYDIANKYKSRQLTVDLARLLY